MNVLPAATSPRRVDRRVSAMGFLLFLTWAMTPMALAQIVFPPMPFQGLAAPRRPSFAQAPGGNGEARVPVTARQVTLFGVIAVPGGATDPRLARVERQLRKILPGHGFRLLGVETKRLLTGDTLTVPLENGYHAAAKLLQPLDENGKVQLRCAVMRDQTTWFESLVATPENQLFFCEKTLPDGSRLLIGVGAR